MARAVLVPLLSLLTGGGTAMADLQLDLAAVRELGTNLSKVADEFENANANSDRVAGAVGHDRLAEVVRDFAHKWDDTRAKMTENLRMLAESSTQVADAFTDTDRELAKVLEGDQPAPPGAARGDQP